MLGNDVVDFSVDEKKYNNQRFINRILSDLEQKYLQQSESKNAFLWSLWSAKEAAYKAYQKTHLSALFSPIQYEISEATLEKLLHTGRTEPLQGVIQYQQKIWIPIEFHWPSSTSVHCVCRFGSAGHSDSIHTKLMRIDAHQSYTIQSLMVRQLAQTLLADLNIHADIIRPEIEVKDYKKPGPPKLVANNHFLEHEISLSHDGEWLAVAVMLTN